MNTPNIIDPFHRSLYNLLADKIDGRVVDLASGSAASIQGAAEMVAEKYAAQVSYIKALNDVLGWCRELELAQYGARPGADTESQGRLGDSFGGA